MPTAKGTFPSNATEADRAKLLEACAAISTDTGIIIPEGMLIELVEASRSGTADYTALHDRMNDAIAKAVLGQTLTSEAKGGQYKGDIQMEVRQDLVKADSDLVCQSFNLQVARWLTAWNFPDALPPQVWRIVDEGEKLNNAANRDAKLHQVGFRPTLARVLKVYGEGYVETRDVETRDGKRSAAYLPAKPSRQETGFSVPETDYYVLVGSPVPACDVVDL